LPNALFLAADGRALPAPFIGRVDDLRITLPWGSLLRAVLAADPALVSLASEGLRPGGTARIVVSLTPADKPAVGSTAADGELRRLAAALTAAGLEVTEPRPLTIDEARDLRSSWAKRLGVPARRPATILEARQAAGLHADRVGSRRSRVVA
jgi:16S rRNA (adenine(1408)-N(1))-methyltransferase